ncbi:MAG: DUF697 domain-containing protein [Magnetococcales bacterium]|nr:DUF697 domain-containing protein [Magnetococcales bacterium]
MTTRPPRPRWTPPVELSPEPHPEETPRATAPVCLPLTEHESRNADPEPEILEPDPSPETLAFTRSGRRWRWFFWSAALLLGGLIVEESALFLVHQFRLHPVLGIFFSGVIGVLLTLLVTAMTREFLSLRELRAQGALRGEAARLMSGGSFGNAQPLIVQLTEQHGHRPELRDSLEAFRAMNQAHLGDREMLELFSSRALRPLDEAALRIIGRHAASAAFLAVISPLAILDALLFLWRNTRMMREIATLYGLRPGPVGTVVLMRHLAEGMLAAGAGEVLAKSASEALGETLAGVVMANAGQAATNALFTARVGLKCLRLCRPIPFPKHEEPGLKQIRRELRAALTAPKTGAS